MKRTVESVPPTGGCPGRGAVPSIWAGMLAAALALGVALTLGAPPPTSGVEELSRTALLPRLDLALHAGSGTAGPLAVASEPRAAGAAPCLGEICQPRVAVPGFEPRYGRAHRSELFVLALTRARMEPLASVAWALTATGLRFDWTPAALEGPGAGAHGWGSLFLRVRLRLDADNLPVFVPRPRWGQRPARRSST